MRDARPQSREERGAGRNRDLAGRTRDLIADVLRVALAILADAAAFALWNLASRSPARLGRDLAAGVNRPAALLSGILRLLAGLFLLAAGAALLLPLAPETRTFSVLETGTVLVGLLVEQIAGLGPRARSS